MRQRREDYRFRTTLRLHYETLASKEKGSGVEVGDKSHMESQNCSKQTWKKW